MSKKLSVVTTAPLFSPRNANQSDYADKIRSNSITLCTGPAGCGKTFVPTVLAIEALLAGKISKIVLVRPAVEACGEKIGFLPGDMTEKMSPFLGPIFDAMNEVWQDEKIQDMIKRGVIEIVPLAFMRGRTFDYSYVLTDEAQNMSEDQMLMLVTRIGKESKLIISGDLDQNDLGNKSSSGLKRAIGLSGKVESLAVAKFDLDDCVRNPIIIDILNNW